MPVKAVFFDLGGTLLVMRRDKVFREILSEEGIEVSQESAHAAYIRVEKWWLTVYGNRALTSAQTDDAYRDLDVKVYLALFPDSSREQTDRAAGFLRERWSDVERAVPPELYPDALPLLAGLKGKGLSMALVSNAPAEIRNLVEALGLTDYLSPIVISGAAGFSKPHPEIFRVALKGAGVLPGETIHVGDLYESDVVGARNAGVNGILLDREENYGAVDCIKISSLAEVEALLD